MDIGHRMKELRIQYGLTQQELAPCRADQGLYLTVGTKPELSVHRNSSGYHPVPWYDTSRIFTDEEPEQIVFKQEDYFEKTDEEKHCCIEWVVPNAQKNQMEPVRLTLHAGGRSEVYQPHEGEDFGYVITGNVRIHYAGQNQTVHAGNLSILKQEKSIIWKTPVRKMPSSSG